MINRVICGVIGHRYVVERVLNYGARKVGCTRCGCKWGMHDATHSFVPWDGELEEFYARGGMLRQEPNPCPPTNSAPCSARTPPMTPKCTSLRGHKFEARYDRRLGNIPPTFKGYGDAAEILEKFREVIYVHDICVRCGAVVKRGERFYRTVFLHGERISFTGNLVYCSSERGIIASGKTKNCFMVKNIVM